MDWLVFGDDWGAHPSTTQHLVRNLPSEDRVLWVNSLGMRAPTLTRHDAKRAWAKLTRQRQAAVAAPVAQTAGPTVIEPPVLPWHRVPPVRALNRLRLQRRLRAALAQHGFVRPTVLVANPVAVQYLAGLELGPVVYLRLDDYARLPGIDATLARAAEAALRQRADLVVATARALLPTVPVRQALYVPQGVDAAHFGQRPLVENPVKVLGFFGLLEQWLDWPLMIAAAQQNPDWTFVYIGRAAYVDPALTALPNVQLLPPVPYAQLPQHLETWRAAWAPFALNELTMAVNPLKLREYLAAGLPTACAPIPEASGVHPDVTLVRTAADVTAWLATTLADTPARALARREAMAAETWAARARVMRDAVLKLA